MKRRACINIFSFRLQVVARDISGKQPLAVIKSDSIDADILSLNQAARRAGIESNMSYREANLLCGNLVAESVHESKLIEIEQMILNKLQDYSPFVWSHSTEHGLFWLDISGLQTLFDSHRQWAEHLDEAIRELGFVASIVCGFTQFGTYGIAKARRGIFVFSDKSNEKKSIKRIPLKALQLSSETNNVLKKLDISRVDDLIDLPPVEIKRRFSEKLYLIHRAARGKYIEPIESENHRDDESTGQVDLEHPIFDISQLVLRIKRILERFISQTSPDRKVREISIELKHKNSSSEINIELGVATREINRLLEFIRMRFDTFESPKQIHGLAISIDWQIKQSQQLNLIGNGSQKPLDRINRALDRIRSRLGSHSVVRARLRQQHRPEDSFEWQRLDKLSFPEPPENPESSRIRRFFEAPEPLEDTRSYRIRNAGYRLSGQWWDVPFARIYRLIESDQGRLCWGYFDQITEKWFIQGELD